jgi:hypothetical protein
MVISTHELNPSDLRYLPCSDPRIADEVEAVNRSIARLDENIPAWSYLDPTSGTPGKEVMV